MKNDISKNRKPNSNEFKETVITLYKQGCSTTQIVNKLTKKYNIDPNDLGRAYINFKSRVGMCVLRHKRKEETHIIRSQLKMCI